MTRAAEYVVITPVRNEAEYLSSTVESMVRQTITPKRWIIVDDGSIDQTRSIANAAARAHPWVQVVCRADRGARKPGGGVVEAFYDGYKLLETEPWDYLVKLDGDLSFDADYFERCFEQFEGNSALGIAGGTVCQRVNAQVKVECGNDPRFHVRGATKIYRRRCWEAIGGLIHAPGWDTLDEVKANMLGWQTRTLPGITLIHHRPTGAASGTWNDRVKAGLANYVAGYHPIFMLLKCIRRAAEKPYLIGACALGYGFVKGYVQKVPQVQDATLIRYLRKEQVNRLLARRSLWG